MVCGVHRLHCLHNLQRNDDDAMMNVQCDLLLLSRRTGVSRREAPLHIAQRTQDDRFDGKRQLNHQKAVRRPRAAAFGVGGGSTAIRSVCECMHICVTHK